MSVPGPDKNPCQDCHHEKDQRGCDWWQVHNEMLAKEVCIAEDWAVIEGVSGLITSSTRATGVKVLVCCQRNDATVVQTSKMVETGRCGNVAGIVIIKGESSS